MITQKPRQAECPRKDLRVVRRASRWLKKQSRLLSVKGSLKVVHRKWNRTRAKNVCEWYRVRGLAPANDCGEVKTYVSRTVSITGPCSRQV